MDDTVTRLADAVRQAGRIVSEADLPDGLQHHAFERTLDVLLAKAALGVGAERSEPAPVPAVPPPPAPARAAPSASLLRIAERAGVGEEAAKAVFRVEGDGLALVVGDKKIDANKATGSRQITLLVAGGRQAAGLEEWTNLMHAREVCSLYNRLDSKNYAATIKSMANAFNFHGQGVHREVRLTMPGWDEWAALVRQLASGAARGRA